MTVLVGRSIIRRLGGLERSALHPGRGPAAGRDRPAAARREGGRGRRGAAAADRRGRDRPGRAGLRHGPADRHPVRGGRSHAAPGSQRRVPQPGRTQPVAAAPPADPPRRDGTTRHRTGRTRRPVPARPPHHSHAPSRRGPGHLGRRAARPRLGQPGPDGRRNARRHRRGRGLRPGPVLPGARRHLPDSPWPTSSTCSPSSSRTPRSCRRRTPRCGVRATSSAKGFAIEIEDRGLGMTPQRLAELNDRLANPPEFNPSDSDRLGLFVVSQLANRHEIKVTLRPSAYGGTTAIVLIPTALVVDRGRVTDKRPALTSGQPASAQSGRLAGRHAAIEHATSRNGASRATAEVDPDYAGTSLAIGGTADLLDPADSAEPVRAGMADPAANGVPEPGGFATPGASSWAASEPSGWGEGEPSGFGAPEPSGFGAREQGAWPAGEPAEFGAREQGAWAAGEPSGFGAREQGAFVAGEPSGFVAGEQGSFAMPDPSAFGLASAGQPDPAADGALEPGRFGAPDPSGLGTPEPNDNGLPTRTVTGLPVSDGDPRVTAAELTDQGLPVRVRQASLAPQAPRQPAGRRTSAERGACQRADTSRNPPDHVGVAARLARGAVAADERTGRLAVRATRPGAVSRRRPGAGRRPVTGESDGT